MPKAGFLGNVKKKEVQILTNKNYYRNVKMTKSLNANLDMWMTYSCQKEGDYMITAVVAKQDIKYIDFEYPKDFNFKEIKNFCKGYKKIVLFFSNRGDFRFTSDKSAKSEFETLNQKCRNRKYCQWKIFCGDVRVILTGRDAITLKKNVVISNEFDNFMAIGYLKTGFGYKTIDYSLDFWLELTKNY